MDSLEPKKLALIRIWQILKDYSDYDHPLTQDEISKYLESEYGIVIERKAISRNISLLKEAGFDITSRRGGTYLECREFGDSELRLLIDGVLSSKFINAGQSKDLINRLCGLSNKYFSSHVKHVLSVNDWGKTNNPALFYNIGTIDNAIESGCQISYDYNKYGTDKKLHKSSYQRVSPYQMILHNQRYYLMAYSEYWNNMVFHRLDRITNIKTVDKKSIPIRDIKGYENGIDYKDLSSTMPYMYADKPEWVKFSADISVVDQIIDWFGTDIRLSEMPGQDKVTVNLKVSLNAMECWAMQYINYVEILQPESLRQRIKETLSSGLKKYEK